MAIAPETSTSARHAVGDYAQPSAAWLRDAFLWRRKAPPEVVPFAELVLVHYLRQLAVYKNREYGGPQEDTYQAKLKAFVATNGRLVEAYWCTRQPSAVAVTERTERSWRRLWLAQHVVSFHSETDWITSECPEIADQVYASRALAVKIQEVLRGTSELIAMQWLVSAVERVLGLVDQSEQPDEKDLARVVAANKKELDAILAYHNKAAEAQARLVYFQGMMRGAALLSGLIAAVALALYASHFSRWHSPTTQALFLTAAMGGAGAIISVMSRMGGKGAFSIDHEVGRKMVRRLGSLRPFIGATFAVALYFGTKSNLVPLGTEKTSSFYAIVAFLAGFSERWARLMLHKAGADEPAEQAEPKGNQRN
jgi:hypothetical protein